MSAPHSQPLSNSHPDALRNGASSTLFPLVLSKDVYPAILRMDVEYQERGSQVVDHSGLSDV